MPPERSKCRDYILLQQVQPAGDLIEASSKLYQHVAAQRVERVRWVGLAVPGHLPEFGEEFV